MNPLRRPLFQPEKNTGAIEYLSLKTILMKILFLIFCMANYNCLNGQTSNAMINAFKKKDISFIVKNCALPFNLQAGSNQDDNILNKTILTSKLKTLFEENYFTEMLKGKKTLSTDSEIIIETRQFNKDGELESESTLAFFFKKGKNGIALLYKIVLAG